jgi:HSP20 family protein
MSLSLHRVWHSGSPFPADARQIFDRFLQSAKSDAADAADRQWAPRVDIREDEQQFVILADIPGVDPAQIEVSMDKGVLSIAGKRELPGSETDGKFTRVERSRGSFQRYFTLPDTANAESISASGKFGVLEITIPKKAQATPRRITINTSH